MKPKSYIESIQTYVPGEEIPGLVKLASNENPLGPSQQAISAAQAAVTQCHRYPNDNAEPLRTLLSERLDISGQQILFGAGSDEIIGMIISTYVGEGDQIYSSASTFPMYKFFAATRGASVVESALTPDFKIDLPAIIDGMEDQDGLVVFADPNNPTGTAIDFDVFLEQVKRKPDSIFLYDAAYEEYRERQQTINWAKVVQDFPNIIVSRTFSKAYGLAGFRIGYCFAHEKRIAEIGKTRPPFNVNAPALAAAHAALLDTDHLNQTLSLNKAVLSEIAAFCTENNLRLVPSSTNFALIELPHRSESSVPSCVWWAEELKRKGFVVRALPSIGYDSFIRVNTGTREQNAAFLKALSELL